MLYNKSQGGDGKGGIEGEGKGRGGERGGGRAKTKEYKNIPSWGVMRVNRLLKGPIPTEVTAAMMQI